MSISPFLKHRLKQVMRMLRINLRPIRPARRTMGDFTKFLAERGFRPATVIDVGVADGTLELYSPFPAAKLLLVEPMREFGPAITAILKRHGGRAFEVAAGAETGELAIAFNDGVAAAHNAAFTGEVEAGRQTRMIPVRRLDDLVVEAAMPGPYLLKVDVEGFECEVLKGASKVLEDADVVSWRPPSTGSTAAARSSTR